MMSRKFMGSSGLMMCLMLVSPCLGEDPASAENQQSPIEAVGARLLQLEAEGRDVSSLKAALGELKPDWNAIQDLQKQIQQKVEVFRPKMEALVGKVRQLAGEGAGGGENGSPGRSPLEDIKQALKGLQSQGKPIADLQADLDGLQPDWARLEEAQRQAMAATPETREALVKNASALADSIRPRVQALAEKLQARAAAEK